MSNGSTERAALGSLDIDMDPLKVTSCLGKLIDPFLADFNVFAVAKVFANRCFESCDSGNHSCGHGFSLANDFNGLRVPETLMFATLRMEQEST